MTWVWLAGGAAVFYALHGAWSKRVAARFGPLRAAWALFAFALPVLAGYLVLNGIPPLGDRFWPVLAVNCVLNLGAAYLFLSALDSGDLGVTYPLLTLTPLFVIPVELVLLGELPGPWGGVGILMVVAGVYLLNFTDPRLGALEPFRALFRSRGARLSLGVAVIWSVTGTLDRVAVLESSAAFYGTALAAGMSVLFLPLVWYAGRRRRLDPRAPALGPSGSNGLKTGWLLLIHGCLFGAMFIVQMEALRLALTSYVLSIKRTGAILAVVLGWLAFREGEFGPRVTGTAVTVAGVAVLVIWG